MPFALIAKFVGAQIIGAIRHAQELRAALQEIARETVRSFNLVADSLRSVRATVHVKHNRLPAIARAIGPAMDEAAREVAELVVAEARKQAPVRTGYLRDNIVLVKVAGGYRAASNAPYSAYLNNGTRHMAAQPFWDQALMVARSAAPTIYQRHLQKALRAG